VLSYIIRRLLLGIVTIFAIITLLFGLEQLLPKSDNPYELLFHRPNQSAAVKRELEAKYGLDQPPLVQYVDYLENVSKPLWTWWGLPPKAPQAPDLGDSLALQQTVVQAIAERAPATAQLMITSYVLALLIAVPLGVISAVKKNSKTDHVITAFAFFGISVPGYWFGIILIYLFAIYPHQNGLPEVFPAGSQHSPGVSSGILDLAWHLMLPAIVLAIQSIASYSRYTRSEMLTSLQQDYIRTARAKGLSELAVVRHAFRNSLLPFITLMGLDIPALFGGAIITEYVFNWPGMGQLFVISAQSNDVPILLGTTLILSILVVIGNLVADVAYTWADPRISYSR
jgi:peptide/nickel transport system permease protein